MNYDLSFDRKTAALLAICTTAAAILLVVAGFLLGVQHQRPTTPASAVSAKMPHDPVVEKLQPSEPTAPALVAKSTPLPTEPLEAPGNLSNAQPDPIAIPVSKSKGAEIPSVKGYILQFGAFREEANAETIIKQLKEKKVNADIFPRKDSAGTTWYTVRFGNYPTLLAASSAAASLRVATQQSILIRPSNTL
jgi:septal ring-binding cell division protein DamX